MSAEREGTGISHTHSVGALRRAPEHSHGTRVRLGRYLRLLLDIVVGKESIRVRTRVVDVK